MREFVQCLLDSVSKDLSDIDPDEVLSVADYMADAVRHGKEIKLSGDGFTEDCVLEAKQISDLAGEKKGNFDLVSSFSEKDDPDSYDALICNRKSQCPDKPSILLHSDDLEGFRSTVASVCKVIFRLAKLNLVGKKAAFIDRDDTIAKDVPYCSDPKDFNLFDGVPESIRKLNDAGYLVILITNQSGIGRGKFTEETLNRIHDKMLREVEKGGGRIDDIFFCPHHPDDKCQCRKPNILMGIRAVEKYDIDPRKSFMIGDSDADMEFGRRLGCKTVRVSKDHTFSDAVNGILI